MRRRRPIRSQQPLELHAGSHPASEYDHRRRDFQCPADGAGNPIDNTQTRDANVYTSRITQDFSLTLPGNAKPTNTPGVVRAFAVQFANNLELTPGTTDARNANVVHV